jgi:hypothetical protein
MDVVIATPSILLLHCDLGHLAHGDVRGAHRRRVNEADPAQARRLAEARAEHT